MSPSEASWRGRPVIVTGGTGFLGVNLTRRLVAGGAAVFVLSRRTSVEAAIYGLPPEASVVAGDIRDADAVRRAIAHVRPEVVFHLASTPFNPPGTSERQHLDVIVGGTSNVLSALATCPAVRVVHAGSGAEYGSGTGLREDAPLRPATALGAAKAAATLVLQAAARQRGQQSVILRLFTPYGPWDRPGRLITQTILLAERGRDIPISDGRQQRDFVYVDDVVRALLLAAEVPIPAGTVLNVSSGRPVAVREIVDTILAIMGSRAHAIPGALPTRPDEIWELSGDNAAAAQALGWHPETSLREGLARTCAWVRANRALLEGPMEVSRP